VAEKKKTTGIAKKSNPALWSRVKAALGRSLEDTLLSQWHGQAVNIRKEAENTLALNQIAARTECESG